jgi:hypothetical protein
MQSESALRPASAGIKGWGGQARLQLRHGIAIPVATTSEEGKLSDLLSPDTTWLSYRELYRDYVDACKDRSVSVGEFKRRFRVMLRYLGVKIEENKSRGGERTYRYIYNPGTTDLRLQPAKATPVVPIISEDIFNHAI